MKSEEKILDLLNKLKKSINNELNSFSKNKRLNKSKKRRKSKKRKRKRKRKTKKQRMY